MDNDLVVIILITHNNGSRNGYAERTIRGVINHLKYPNLAWYVADGCSTKEHLESVMSELKGQNIIGWHTNPSQTSYGTDANKAWHVAHDQANLTIWLEDDWEMEKDLNISPYVDLLNNYRDLGLVRMGYLNVNMRGHCIGRDGKLYWLLDRNADSYVFTGHPSLRHRRYREAYGPYPEGLNPGNTELAYASQYRHAQFGGPEIVWPAELGEWGPFGHIGAVQSY